MQEKFTLVFDYINEVKTRCTYNAGAEALGITTSAFKKLLGEPRPETSWFVSATTAEPARHEESLRHPELLRTKRMITSGKVLKRNLNL